MGSNHDHLLSAFAVSCELRLDKKEDARGQKQKKKEKRKEQRVKGRDQGQPLHLI